MQSYKETASSIFIYTLTLLWWYKFLLQFISFIRVELHVSLKILTLTAGYILLNMVKISNPLT